MFLEAQIVSLYSPNVPTMSIRIIQCFIIYTLFISRAKPEVNSSPLKPTTSSSRGLSLCQLGFILLGCVCLDYFSLAYFRNQVFRSDESFIRESLFSTECPSGFVSENVTNPGKCVTSLSVINDLNEMLSVLLFAGNVYLLQIVFLWNVVLQ